ncbi:MAG: efflux RND transporter periplasmic adaptor subunit, partial [Burkholderiales bacterium]
ISSSARIELGAQATSTVERVLVREGDRVKAGQLLVQLRDDEAEAAVKQARAALSEARAKIRQIEVVARPVGDQAVHQAASNLQLADVEYQRNKDLVAKGFVSQSRLDDALRNLENARSALTSARAQATANDKTGAEYQLAVARLEQSQASLLVAQARLANQAILAPVDAQVLTRTVEAGDVAQAGKSIMVLAQSGETRITANVDEKNLRHLKAGFKAVAVADAYPADPFDAEIYYVAPSVDAQRGTVEIRLRVLNPPSFARPDMTVSVEMIVGRRDGVLVVPAEAIRGADSARPFALVLRDGRAEQVPVKLGLRGVGVAEIVEGANEGDVLILPNAAALPGDRVRAKPERAASKAPSPGTKRPGTTPVPGTS